MNKTNFPFPNSFFWLPATNNKRMRTKMVTLYYYLKPYSCQHCSAFFL